MKERIPVQIKVKKDQRTGLQQTGKYVCSEITIQQDNEYRGANYLLALLVVILQAITLLATVIGSRSGGCDGGMKKVILSLALGTFGLGMAEFGIMGVLTELAHNVGISIPAAGHMISYYALGWWSVRQSSHSFPAATHSNISCCFWWRCASLASHVHALFVLPDARHWSAGFRLSAWRIFGVGAIVLSKLSNPESHRRRGGMVSG